MLLARNEDYSNRLDLTIGESTKTHHGYGMLFLHNLPRMVVVKREGSGGELGRR